MYNHSAANILMMLASIPSYEGKTTIVEDKEPGGISSQLEEAGF